MHLFSFASSRRVRDNEMVARDAAALLDAWGDLAHDVARNLCWREDAGLLVTTTPGHWGRVCDLVGARLGVVEPSMDLWLKAA